MYVDNWQWLSWDNVPGLLDWIGFIFGGSGMVVALVQLFRTKGALKRAREELDRARLEWVDRDLQTRLAVFHHLSREVDQAINADDRAALGDALGRLSNECGRSLALLNAGEPRNRKVDETLRDDLETCASAASSAWAELFDHPGLSCHEIAGHGATRIRLAVPGIEAALTSIKYEPTAGSTVRKKGGRRAH